MGRSKFNSHSCFRSGKKNVSKRRIKQQVIEPHVASLPTPKGQQEIQISASKRKLLLFGIEIDDVDSVNVESDPHINNCDDDQYIVIQVIQIKKLLFEVLCPNCKKPGIQLTQKPEDDLGFAVRIVIECTTCMGYTRAEYSSQRIGEPGSVKNAPIDLNVRSNLTFRGVDCDHSAMKGWCSIMKMSSMLNKNTYTSTNTNNKLEEAASRIFDVASQTTEKIVREAYAQIGVTEDKYGILDIAFSYDGTWQKGGHILLTMVLLVQLTC